MLTLLIVDDEEMIVEGLQLLIPWHTLGIEKIYTAHSGEEAVEIIDREPLDILLTDISMDGMNGLDVVEYLKKRNPNAAAIILSGYDEFAYVKRGLQLGIENYLLKPVSREELVQTIETIKNRMQTTLDVGIEENVMREHLTKRLFFNQIGKRECMERMTLLGLPIPKLSCRAVLLQWDNHKEERDISFREMATLLEQNGYVYVTQLDHSRLGFLIEIEPIAQVRDAINILERQLRERYVGIRYQLHIGSDASLFDGFEKSVKHAEFVRDWAHLQTGQKSYYYEEVKKSVQSDAPLLGDDTLTSLEECIQVRDRPGIKNHLSMMFKETLSTASSVQMMNLSYGLLLKLFQGFNQVNLESIEGYISDLNQVTEVDGILCVFDHVLEDLFHLSQVAQYSKSVKAVLENVEKEYDTPLSLKELSQRHHVNTAYLGQLFQKEVGVSFSEYLNDYRMQIAKVKLSQTSETIEWIAMSTGFKEVSYFSRKFKQLFDMSPHDYRLKMIGE